MWQGASFQDALPMFDKMSARGHTGRLSSLPGFARLLIWSCWVGVARKKKVTCGGPWSLILAWMRASPSCLFHSKRGKTTNSKPRGSFQTPQPPLTSEPLSSFYATGSNAVHCWALSVLLQVLLICLLSLFWSFLKGNKSNWWREAMEKSLTRKNPQKKTAALTNCLFPCSELVPT